MRRYPIVRQEKKAVYQGIQERSCGAGTRQNYSIFQAAQSLGINGNMLARWRREYGDRERNAFPGTGHQPGETLS